MPSRHPVDTHKIHNRARQRGGTPADKSFTSALDFSSPALRRRGSDGGNSGSRDSSKLSPHASSRAIDSTSELHPLRRSSSTTVETARYDTGSTRPRLSRALSSSPPVLARPDPPPEKAESHRTVLAHEVSPNDTLAGVALKYGISVTELRRVNQLWASDSIHLRQVLYVPLDKARHANLETVASLLAQGSDSEGDPVLHSDSSRLDPSPVVRRVPPTSLSFFPPPSSSASAPPEARSTPTSSPPPSHSRSHSPATISTPPRGSNMTSNLRANALSSLFSVLPINASTRDEIMSRLSIDSVSNSTTGTTSDEAEHELTPVPATPKPRTDTSVPIPAPFLANPRRKRPARTWLSDSRDADGHQEPHARDVEHIALASSPIHTTQLQPAPVMQLPEYMMRSPPKGGTPNNSHNGARRSSSDHPRTR